MTEGFWLLLRAAGLMLTLQAAGAALTPLWASAPRAPAWAPLLGALGVILLQLGFEPIHMAGEWSGIGAAPLWRLMAHDSAAHALALRGAGVALLWVAHGAGRRGRWIMWGAFPLVVGSFVLTGHTRSAGRPGLLGAALALHVAAAAFWYGSLPQLMTLLRTHAAPAALAAITAFSRVALWLVPLLAGAGALLAWLLLPDLAALRLPYGQLLLGKIALFLAAFALAARHRLRLTPALAVGAADAAARLRRSILIEFLLLSALLAVTAVMTGRFSPAGD
jgi:putative copper export protein